MTDRFAAVIPCSRVSTVGRPLPTADVGYPAAQLRGQLSHVCAAVLGDILVGARLLADDVVGGEAEAHEAHVSLLAVKGLELLEQR